MIESCSRVTRIFTDRRGSLACWRTLGLGRLRRGIRTGRVSCARVTRIFTDRRGSLACWRTLGFNCACGAGLSPTLKGTACNRAKPVFSPGALAPQRSASDPRRSASPTGRLVVAQSASPIESRNLTPPYPHGAACNRAKPVFSPGAPAPQRSALDPRRSASPIESRNLTPPYPHGTASRVTRIFADRRGSLARWHALGFNCACGAGLSPTLKGAACNRAKPVFSPGALAPQRSAPDPRRSASPTGRLVVAQSASPTEK